MKLLKIFIQIIGLYLFYLLGDFLSDLLKLPIPGSIVGLLLLFICLHFKFIPDTYIKDGAGVLLAWLPLFYIPAIVGVVQYPEFLSGKGAILIGITLVSTLLTMIVVGRVSELYEKKMKARKE